MRKKPTDKLIKLYQDTIDNLLLNFEKKLREGKVLDYEVYLIKSLLKAFKEAKEIRGEIRHSLQEEIETIYSMFNYKLGRAENGIGRQV